MYSSHDSTVARMTDAQVLEAAAQIVEECLPILERMAPGDILDATLLPSSKQSLESGFRLAIATAMHPASRRRLVMLGQLLARFQPGVGGKISLSPAPAATGAVERDTLFGKQIEHILEQAELERVRLARLFMEADAIARRRFQPDARSPLRDDGTYSWYGHGSRH